MKMYQLIIAIFLLLFKVKEVPRCQIDDKRVVEIICERCVKMIKLDLKVKNASYLNKKIKVLSSEECGCDCQFCIEQDATEIRLYYSEVFYEEVIKKTKSGIFPIIGHELGHIVMDNSNLTPHQKELQSDSISGALCMLNGLDIVTSLENLCYYAECKNCVSHPPLSVRKQALIRGWANMYFEKHISPRGTSYLSPQELSALKKQLVNAINYYLEKNVPPSVSLTGVYLHPSEKFSQITQYMENRRLNLNLPTGFLLRIDNIWEYSEEEKCTLQILEFYLLDDRMESRR